MTTTRAAAVLAAALFGGGCATAPDEAPGRSKSHVTRFSASPIDAGMPRGWQPWALSRFKKETRYELVERDGRTVVKASADGSASGLLHHLDLDPNERPLLTFRWKVNELIAAADNTRRHAEDSPARLLVVFDGDTDKLPLEDRLLGDLFRFATGQAMPYATLIYIWENRLEEGTVIPSPFTSRIQMIVARSGRRGLGEWQDITRNVAEDYRRAFGEPPGKVVAVAIMTDGDNTSSLASAYYGDIGFHKGARPGAGDPHPADSQGGQP